MQPGWLSRQIRDLDSASLCWRELFSKRWQTVNGRSSHISSTTLRRPRPSVGTQVPHAGRDNGTGVAGLWQCAHVLTWCLATRSTLLRCCISSMLQTCAHHILRYAYYPYIWANHRCRRAQHTPNGGNCLQIERRFRGVSEAPKLLVYSAKRAILARSIGQPQQHARRRNGKPATTRPRARITPLPSSFLRSFLPVIKLVVLRHASIYFGSFFLNMSRSRALCLAALAPERAPSLASSFITSPRLPCKRLMPTVSTTPIASGTHIGGNSLLTISPTCRRSRLCCRRQRRILSH